VASASEPGEGLSRGGWRPRNGLTLTPRWKAHLLTGDRKGTWSLFVTKNWRITFRIDQAEIEIIEMRWLMFRGRWTVLLMGFARRAFLAEPSRGL
jgi:hypothetical protein